MKGQPRLHATTHIEEVKSHITINVSESPMHIHPNKAGSAYIQQR
jgi:hypothetical protein